MIKSRLGNANSILQNVTTKLEQETIYILQSGISAEKIVMAVILTPVFAFLSIIMELIFLFTES